MNIGLIVGVVLGELTLYSQLSSYGYNPLLVFAIVLISAAMVIWGGSRLTSKSAKEKKK
jgi:predicted MFS family arabinose efflux permease